MGYFNEATVKKITHRITKTIFNSSGKTAQGASGIITEMAEDMTKFFPFLLYPGGHPADDKMHLIEL